MDAGLIFALIWSVLAVGWGAWLVAKRTQLAELSRRHRESQNLMTTSRGGLSAGVVGVVGAAFILIGVVLLVFVLIGAAR